MDRKIKTSKVLSCGLIFYYLYFVIWIQFPAAHDVLDDLFQGRVKSLVILRGIHNHPAKLPFVVLENHAISFISIHKCNTCHTYTPNYHITRIDTNLFLYPGLKEVRQKFSAFHQQPPRTIFHRRAPPACLL